MLHPRKKTEKRYTKSSTNKTNTNEARPAGLDSRTWAHGRKVLKKRIMFMTVLKCHMIHPQKSHTKIHTTTQNQKKARNVGSEPGTLAYRVEAVPAEEKKEMQRTIPRGGMTMFHPRKKAHSIRMETQKRRREKIPGGNYLRKLWKSPLKSFPRIPFFPGDRASRPL